MSKGFKLSLLAIVGIIVFVFGFSSLYKPKVDKEIEAQRDPQGQQVDIESTAGYKLLARIEKQPPPLSDARISAFNGKIGVVSEATGLTPIRIADMVYGVINHDSKIDIWDVFDIAQQGVVEKLFPLQSASTDAELKKYLDFSFQSQDLGLSPQAFSKRFNEIAQKRDLDFRIKNSKMNWSKNNKVFSYLVNKHVVVSGVLDQENLESVIINGSGDGTVLSGSNIIFTICTVVEVFSTETKAPCNDVIELMSKVHDQKGEKKSSSMVLDGIKYSMTVSDMLGTMVYIEKFNPYAKSKN